MTGVLNMSNITSKIRELKSHKSDLKKMNTMMRILEMQRAPQWMQDYVTHTQISMEDKISYSLAMMENKMSLLE